MGVQLKDLVVKKEIDLEYLSGKKIAIDAFNWIYQFLSIIRDRDTGQPLKNSKGEITSHLSGIFYRTAKLVEVGIRPVWVFDGKPPEFKFVTGERSAKKEEAHKRLEVARAVGDIEEIRIAAQQTAHLTGEMVEQSKQLLEFMGIPFVQAPSEGEAQCAYLCKSRQVYATASQDMDTLLFGTERLVRNLSISGRKKVAGKNEYTQIKPNIIELKEMLASLGITREQLIVLGMLVGTDFNPGIKGYGPKRAFELVKQEKTLENVLKKIEWNAEIAPESVYDFFLNPVVEKKVEIRFGAPKSEKLLRFLCDRFEFSRERIEKVVKILEQKNRSSLDMWMKK